MADMAFSAFLFALMAAGAKHLGKTIPLQEAVFFRGVVCAFLTWAWLTKHRIPWRGSRPLVLALRGGLGHLALSAYFWSVAHQPLANAVLYQQVSPLFTAILAYWLLREKPGPRFLPAFTLAVLGVYALVSEGSGPLVSSPLAPFIGLCGALMSGGAYVAVRDASRTDHAMTIVLWFPLMSIPMAIPGILLEGPVMPHGSQWGWLIFVALTGQAGQVYLTRGLSKVPAARATLANPLTVVFGAILGWVAFGETLGWNTLTGGLALTAAVLLAGRQPAKESNKAASGSGTSGEGLNNSAPSRPDAA